MRVIHVAQTHNFCTKAVNEFSELMREKRSEDWKLLKKLTLIIHDDYWWPYLRTGGLFFIHFVCLPRRRIDEVRTQKDWRLNFRTCHVSLLLLQASPLNFINFPKERRHLLIFYKSGVSYFFKLKLHVYENFILEFEMRLLLLTLQKLIIPYKIFSNCCLNMHC
jgi:hypothetical protein